MRLSILLLVIATIIACAQVQLPVKNPGFELDADGDGMPDNWRISWRSTHSSDAERGIEKQEPDWAWDKGVKHTGHASIRCGVNRPVDDGVWTQENIPRPEGAKFLKVTAWIRAEGVDGADGRVALVFLREDGKWLDANYSAITVPADCDWTQYTGYAEVPEQTDKIRLRCWVNFHYTGTGTFWFDDIELRTVEKMIEPKTVYRDDRASRPPTQQERQWGFMAFSRNYLRTLFPNAAVEAGEFPDLNVGVCAGEYEPMTLALRPLQDLQNVTVTATDFEGDAGTISHENIDVRAVRFHPKQGQARWGPFNETLMEVPLFLQKPDGTDLQAEAVQPFWLTVHAPDDAAPGVYEGAVIVSVDGRQRARLPAQIRVHPFHLAAPDGVCFAMYTRMRSDPAWIAETFADMRAHGMTSVALCGNSGLEMSQNDDGVQIHWNGESELEKNMAAYVATGFPEPMVWLMGGDIPRFCENIAPIDTEQFAQCYTDVMQGIIDHGKQVGWPEIIFQPIDEPFGHKKRMPRAKRLLQVLKTIPGLRTEEDGMDADWELFMNEVYDVTDVLVLHDGPTLHRGTLDMDEWWSFLEKAGADGKTVWFYNIDLTAWHPAPMRYMYGFGLWKSKATGVIEWAYMWPVDPDQPGEVYGRPGALLFRFPEAPGETGGPTIGYEAIREGIDDYRYLLTLEKLVERAKASDEPKAADLAQQVWTPVQEKLDQAGFQCSTGRAAQGNWTGKCEYLPDGNRVVRGDHKIDNGWDFDDYQQLRGLIARGIGKLSRAMKQ